MIDNPLPDQIMQEMDRVHAAWELEELCKDHALKLATDNFVYEELIGDFQEWFYLMFPLKQLEYHLPKLWECQLQSKQLTYQ